MMFRFIPLETHSAAMLMALDEACMEFVRNGVSPPTIRLYRWSPSAVSIGNFQCLLDEVDLSQTKKMGVDVVRRETGGGAVYHDSVGEVTYSIIGPEELFSQDIAKSYEEVCSVIVKALQSIGLDAIFRPINDLYVEGKKISGNAQTRKGGVFLQHGTILLSVDPQKMFSLLTPDKSKLSDKPYIKSVKAAVTSVFDHLSIDRADVEEAIRREFVNKFSAKPGVWSPEELARAKELAQTKYSQESWNAMR